MRRRKSLSVTVSVAALALITVMSVSRSHAQDWAVKADVAESCNCDITCPCNFGSRHTHDYCEGTRLIEIRDGHLGDIDLDGVSLAVTFRMSAWSKVYVSDNATDEQMKAIDELMPIAFKGFHDAGILSMEKVPMRVERGDGTMKFSVPESTVEIELMKGRNNQAVKIHNLPSPVFADYTQYKSVVTSHQSEDKEFSYSGTNGFTSKMEVGGKK